jgi:hypothetical protein
MIITIEKSHGSHKTPEPYTIYNLAGFQIVCGGGVPPTVGHDIAPISSRGIAT